MRTPLIKVAGTAAAVAGAAAAVAGAAALGASVAATPPAKSGQAQPRTGESPAAPADQTKPQSPLDKAKPVPPPKLAVHPESGLSLVPMKVGAQDVVVELANTQASRTRGLGGRADVPVGTGMLFVFPNASVLNFWMKDCLVAIDVAFMDAQGKVLAVHTMPAAPLRGQTESMAEYEARLQRYSSGTEAVYALELREGEFKRLGVQPGSVIALPAIKR